MNARRDTSDLSNNLWILFDKAGREVLSCILPWTVDTPEEAVTAMTAVMDDLKKQVKRHPTPKEPERLAELQRLIDEDSDYVEPSEEAIAARQEMAEIQERVNGRMFPARKVEQNGERQKDEARIAARKRDAEFDQAAADVALEAALTQAAQGLVASAGTEAQLVLQREPNSPEVANALAHALHGEAGRAVRFGNLDKATLLAGVSRRLALTGDQR